MQGEDDFSPDLSYWIDLSENIVDVSADWERFALDNGGRGIEARQVLGRSLLSFVHGDVSRMFVRTLIQSARLLRRPLVRPYRCDSPTTRRYMEMRLSLDDSGLLRWEHRTVRTEPMQHALHFTVQQQGRPLARPGRLVRCSMCNRVKAGQDWGEADQVFTHAEDDREILVIYGVCPDCLGQRNNPR